MLTVLEVGGGSSPGPYFPEADTYISIDADPEEVAFVNERPSKIESRWGDATKLQDFPDSTIDLVIARNVFGDPLLGYIDDRKTQAFDCVDPSTTKLGILAASARVLKPSGKLLIVEQYTPDIAERWFGEDPVTIGELIIRRANLEDIAPPKYASYHMPVNPASWLGVKVQS